MNFTRYLESLMKKTVFVTGATGLLGNNLVRQLIDKGYHVIYLQLGEIEVDIGYCSKK